MTTVEQSLEGTTEEARAGLLRFHSRGGTCGGLYGDYWSATPCGQPVGWRVVHEDAHAGMTLNGHFRPATSAVGMCNEHLTALRAEPRRIFSVAEASGAVGSISIINTTALDQLLDGAS